MKTITDIQAIAEEMENNFVSIRDAASSALEEKIFPLYDESPEIRKVMRDLEMMENGEYSIDEMGELIYSVEVPSPICDFPLINDYLTKDYLFLTGKKHNDLRLAQSCGGFISVDFGHERGTYFVFDHEERKAVIEKEAEWMDEAYVAAKIELYQHKIGCFGDVIRVNSRYGWYESHFDTFKALGIKTELSKEQLEEIVNDYETRNEEE